MTSSDRAQTIEPIDIENSEVTENGIFFPIYSLLKCSKKNRPVRVVKCIKFDEPSLDVCSYVIAYMQKSLKYRIRDVNKGLPNPRQLFLSYSTGKPLRRATISKYLLEVLSFAELSRPLSKPTLIEGPSPPSCQNAVHPLDKFLPRVTGNRWVLLKGTIIDMQITV